MPRGVPRMGTRKNQTMHEAPEVLGTIQYDHPVLDPTPQGPEVLYQAEDGTQVDLREEPPPWELEDATHVDSDARRYVAVPETWSLRWINPRVLVTDGWRYWRPVMKSDPRVTVKVDQMVGPDGNVRRGGTTGDILAYMPTTWVDSRRKIQGHKTAVQTQTAVDKQQQLREEVRQISPYLTVESATHPRFTSVDGRSIKDD